MGSDSSSRSNEMELRSEHLAVLNVFRKHRVGRGQFLLIQVLRREREDLPREIQENWSEIIKTLTDAGHILRDPLGYSLTEKGQASLCRSPSQPAADPPASGPGGLT